MDLRTILLISLSAVILIALGVIPAVIASKKGFSFVLWWLYGVFALIPAVIHACVLPKRYETDSTRGGEGFAAAAGVCYVAILAAYAVEIAIDGVPLYDYEIISTAGDWLTLSFVIAQMAYAMFFAVALFTNSKNTSACAAGMISFLGLSRVLGSSYLLSRRMDAFVTQNFSAENYKMAMDYYKWVFGQDLAVIFSVAAYAFLFALLINSLKGKRLAKKTWFIPAVLILAELAMRYILCGVNDMYAVSEIFHAAEKFVEIGAVLLIGLWLRSASAERASAGGYQNGYEDYTESPLDSAAADEVADKLKRYKELLDLNIITEQEFDEKKKELFKRL